MKKKTLFIWMVLLTSLAGFINTISIFGYDGMTVSHVTGLVSKLAIGVAQCDLSASLEVLVIILSFLVGSIVSGFITGERDFYLHKSYGFIILAIGSLINLAYVDFHGYKTCLFAIIMGLQNGMVVSFNGVVVRMTHMSGNLTDLGVYIGYKLRRNKNEKAITGIIPGTALISFMVGGIIGVLLYTSVKNAVFYIASIVYIILGIVYFAVQRKCKDKNFNGIDDDLENLE